MEKLHSEVYGFVSTHHEGNIDPPKLVIQLLHSGRQGDGCSKDNLGSWNLEKWNHSPNPVCWPMSLCHVFTPRLIPEAFGYLWERVGVTLVFAFWLSFLMPGKSELLGTGANAICLWAWLVKHCGGWCPKFSEWVFALQQMFFFFSFPTSRCHLGFWQ